MNLYMYEQSYCCHLRPLIHILIYTGEGYLGVDCMTYTNDLYWYFGDMNVSQSGRPCVPWQLAENTFLLSFISFPGEALSSVGNKCR